MQYTEYRTYIPPTYLETGEVMAIIGAVSSVSRHIERDTLLLKVLWQTGGRITEVLELIPKRVGNTSVILKNLKQKSEAPPYKEVYITPDLIQELRGYCRHIHEDDYVFKPNRSKTGHLSRFYVNWMMGKAARLVNVKRVNTRTGEFSFAWPHLFRHSCGMYILDKTGSTELAQRQLGHARLSTTQGYAVLKLEKSRKKLSDLDWR